MAILKVSLSIGFAGVEHTDEIEINDDDLNACETDSERDDLMHEFWVEWSNNYIDGSYSIKE